MLNSGDPKTASIGITPAGQLEPFTACVTALAAASHPSAACSLTQLVPPLPASPILHGSSSLPKDSSDRAKDSGAQFPKGRALPLTMPELRSSALIASWLAAALYGLAITCSMMTSSSLLLGPPLDDPLVSLASWALQSPISAGVEPLARNGGRGRGPAEASCPGCVVVAPSFSL